MILAAFLWACYTLAVKRVVAATRPLVVVTIVNTFATLFFLVLASVRSRPQQFLEIRPIDQAIIVISGLLCISLAHPLYFRAVERLGVAVCASFLLVQPLLVGIVSAIFLKEHLRTPQILMGAMLLTGVSLALRARYPGGGKSPKPPLEETDDAS